LDIKEIKYCGYREHFIIRSIIIFKGLGKVDLWLSKHHSLKAYGK
jgi:hypothetical protein